MSPLAATPLRILHVEDVPADAELAERELFKAGIALETRRVETREAFLAALQDFAPDLILSDYRLPEFDGMQALLIAREVAPDVPIIITTGSINEETAVACMKAGAADYVLKEQLGHLGTAVRSALEKHRLLAERKRAEDRIRQLNRLLRTISEINQAIVHTDDRDALLSQTCRILVEHGGFRMAWVGLADREKGLVLPAARAGDAAHYLEKITVRFDETPEGRGPVGAAIRTERHVVVSDLAVEATVAPWRERMLAHGFRTVGVFPFRVRGEVAGTLTVYLSEPGAIGDEETTLLDELAADLGYALEAMEDRAERRKAEEGLRDSEERLRLAQQVAQIGSFEWNIQSGVNRWSPELEALYGLPRGGFSGTQEAFTKLIHPEDLQAVERWVTNSFEKGTEEGEWRVIWPDGTVHWMSGRWQVFKDESGNPLRMIGVNIDITGRKRAQEALGQSEQKLRAFFDSGLIGMVFGDLQGQVLDANDEYLRIIGYTREELRAGEIRWDRLTVPEYLSKDDQRNAEARERGACTPYEKQYVRKDGTRIWVLVGYVVLPPEREKTVAFVLDISGEKGAEEALRASQKTLRALIDSSPDATLLLDPDGTVISCNRAVADEFGKSIREIVGRCIFDFMPADVAAARRKRVEEVSVTNRLARDREEIRGRIQDVILVPIEGEGGRVAQVAIFVRDVTDLERARADLAKSELYFRSLIEHSLDITAVLGPGGEMRYVSSSVKRILGYGPEEVQGTVAFDLVHPEDRSEAQDKLGRILRSETPFAAVEARLRHRDGSWRTLSVTGKRLPPEIGELGLIVSARDLTERLQLEGQLRQSQKMEAVGRLAGGVAHDFNNLLTVIQGYGELLAKSLEGDKARREELAEIMNAAERAATLTRQLLAFSRRQVLEMRVLDLGAVIADTEKMLRRLIGEDIDLVVVRPAGPAFVKADPGQIDQVLLNLAVNARDAMPKGGRLTVEVADLDLDSPLSSLDETVPPGRYVVASVSDMGTGMDSETLAHIFEPFFTTKEKGKGTGLGLSTVFGIVKQSSGHVLVESAPGRGTTFRVFLPRVDGEGAAVAPILRTGASAKGSETILVVEDEVQIRALIRASLAAYGYTVLDAASAEEALSLSGRHAGPLDLLLTDVVLKGESGRTLADRLLALRPGVKVLYMSGYTDNVISHHGVLEPGLVFLQKPFTPAALARKVREALEGRPPGVAPGFD